MIWVSGPDRLCSFFSKGWLSFTGRALEEELGNGWMECVHPDDRDRCFAIHSASLDTRSAFQLEYRLRRKDGEFRWLLCTGVPRFQPDDMFAGHIGSCHDITDLKRNQEKALAGQKLESLGLLASGIAHDFNNLLGGILVSADLALMEHDAGASPQEAIARIKTAAIGGAEIVRQLMIFGGRQSPAFEEVDISRLVREMLQLLKVSISKYATLKTEFGHGLPAVRANLAQIRQVVMNLVINASDAIGEQEGEIRVTTGSVTIDEHTDYLSLEITDTGCGMTEQQRAKIFDPFFTTKPAGRGLGLAVVQGIVHAHGGAIHVLSGPGRGTTFQILLPCAGIDQQYSQNAAGPRSACQPLSLAGTILIIEDEDSIRVSVSKILRKLGLAVVEAMDGVTGVELFLKNASIVDVVLLDMTLPGKSGREILQILQEVRPDVKVILTSAYSRERVLSSLGGLQPFAFVQKPYQPGDLLDILKDPASKRSEGGGQQNNCDLLAQQPR
jgi:two-component system, cell cycle sensor histidine kinase and response regulator CckA